MSASIILIEDNASFRDAMAFLLESEEGIKVVGQAGTLSEAHRLLTEDVDLALVDLGLPDGSGIEFVKEFRRLNPEGIALVLSSILDSRNTDLAMQAGAAEALNKTAGVDEIVGAVKRLKKG